MRISGTVGDGLIHPVLEEVLPPHPTAPTELQCYHCKETKPATHFAKSKRSCHRKRGFRAGNCKQCHTTWNRSYRQRKTVDLTSL